MAGEIERLNLSVSELSGDNANIKCVLDMKQNYLQGKTINKENIPLTPNAFKILYVEESSSGKDQNSKEANHPRGPPNDSTRRRTLPKPEGKELRNPPRSRARRKQYW
jgi:hypothetical protein